MAIRTVTDTVVPVTAPPPDLAALEARLDALRARFPGAIWARYLGHVPTVAAEVFVAPGAALIGDVRLAEGASVWFGCVLRADLSRIEVGARSNIQDGAVIHLGDNDPVIVGEDVVVGHRAVLHGCTVGDGCLIGIQATVLDGAQIGAGSIIGAGAGVPAGTVVPPRSLVLGMPGKVVKELPEESAAFNRSLAAKYLRLQGNHRRG
jgi:carbonic anhydrase/acetyltransferase-like protein (isoleucine patch superfamily)